MNILNEFCHKCLFILLQFFGIDTFIHIKDTLLFLFAFSGGMVIQTFILAKVAHNIRTDSSLKHIAVMRVKKEDKIFYYTNFESNSMLDIVYRTMIIGYMKVFRKKHIEITDYKKVKRFALALLIFELILFGLGFLLVFNSIDGNYWLKELEKQEMFK